jgi:hypothetical protein
MHRASFSGVAKFFSSFAGGAGSVFAIGERPDCVLGKQDEK